MELTINNLFSEAAQELSEAEYELNRPLEDVVVFAVCSHTKEAIRKMLTAFLAFESMNENNSSSLNDKLDELKQLGTLMLLNECITKQQAFGSLDASALECCRGENNHGYSDYCLEIDQVRLCAELGRNVEQTVRTFTGF